MALPIRQGATHKIAIGPVVAVGDGFTPITNLDISTADEAEVILHDNDTVVNISGYTFAAIAVADGYYHLTLQTGISNIVGHMTVIINDDSLCLPIREDFVVLDTAAYDAIYKDEAVMAVTVPGAVGSVSGNVDGSVASVTSKTGYSLSTAGILAIWHQLVSAVVAASTMGKLVVDFLNASITSRQPSGAVDLNADQSGVTIGTVSTVTDGATSAQVDSLAATSGVGAIPHIPSSVAVVGTPTGSLDNLANEDTDVYVVTDDAGNITVDFVYQFPAGVVGVEFILVVAAQGNSDDITLQFFDQVGSAYDTIHTIVGSNGLSESPFVKTVLQKYTTNTGLMQVRLIGTGLSSAILTINKAVVNAISTSGGVTNGSTITLASSENNKNFIGHNWILALGGQDIGGSFFEGGKSVSGVGTCSKGAPYKFKNFIMDSPTLTSEGQFNDCDWHGGIFTSSAGGVADEVTIRRGDSHVAGMNAPEMTWAAVTKTTSISIRGWMGGSIWTFTSNCTASIEVLHGGGHTINANGATDVEFRGSARSLVIVLTGGETVQVNAECGPITISGAGVGSTINIYGRHAGITNTATGSPTVEDAAFNSSIVATSTAQATAQSDLDKITGSDGTTLASAQGNYAPNVVVPDAEGTAPTAAEIDTELKSSHGVGSWLTGAGGSAPTAQQNREEMDANSTKLAAIVEDTGTTIPALLPAALVSGRMNCNISAINDVNQSAVNLERSASVIITGVATAGTLSTTQMSTNLSEATNDHYNGRIIIWTSGVLVGQATDITDYVGVGGVCTFTAVTEVPSNSDTFVIV